MAQLGPDAYQFMKELYSNNSKEWFDANRTRYETVLRDPFKALVKELTGPISMLLPELDAKPKISRINNDLRFQPDKQPYKEHVWCSFGEGHSVIFFGLSREGWSAGCMIGSKKKSDMADWRINLMNERDRWEAYMESLQKLGGIRSHIGACYNRPLIEGIPDSVFDLVQAKDLVLYSVPRAKASKQLERDILMMTACMLPAWTYMTSPPKELLARLERLGDEITAPFPEVEAVWSSLQRAK